MTAITITRPQAAELPEHSSENLSITLTQELGAEPVDDSDLRAAIDSIYQLLRNEVERRLASPSPAVPTPTAMLPSASCRRTCSLVRPFPPASRNATGTDRNLEAGQLPARPRCPAGPLLRRTGRCPSAGGREAGSAPTHEP